MPDAYEPCTCGSGKKYKFCCRRFEPLLRRIRSLIEELPAEALEEVRKAKLTEPDHVFLITWEAMCLVGMERTDEALGVLRQAAKRLEPCPLIHLCIGDILSEFDAGAFRAIPEYELAASTFADNKNKAGAFLSLAKMHMEMGHSEEAIAVVQKSLELHYTTEAARLLEECRHMDMEAEDDAVPDGWDYDDEDDGDEFWDCDQLLGLAAAAVAEGDLDDAEGFYEEVIDIDPGNPEACQFLLKRYDEQGRLDEMSELQDLFCENVFARDDVPELIRIQAAGYLACAGVLGTFKDTDRFIDIIVKHYGVEDGARRLEELKKLLRPDSFKKDKQSPENSRAIGKLQGFYLTNVWIWEENPYLDDDTPMSAAQTPEGRACLQRLIAGMASTSESLPRFAFDAGKLRATLGLDAPEASEPQA